MAHSGGNALQLHGGWPIDDASGTGACVSSLVYGMKDASESVKRSENKHSHAHFSTYNATALCGATSSGTLNASATASAPPTHTYDARDPRPRPTSPRRARATTCEASLRTANGRAGATERALGP